MTEKIRHFEMQSSVPLDSWKVEFCKKLFYLNSQNVVHIWSSATAFKDFQRKHGFTLSAQQVMWHQQHFTFLGKLSLNIGGGIDWSEKFGKIIQNGQNMVLGQQTLSKRPFAFFCPRGGRCTS